VSDRDFVQRRKIWKEFPDENSTILHFKSIDHKNCPVKKNVIRAETILSGYFIKKISDNPPKTFLSIISQNDIKGKIPTYLVNKVSQTAPKDWVKSLVKGCEIVKNMNNIK
jgi:glutaredoxin-related protein